MEPSTIKYLALRVLVAAYGLTGNRLHDVVRSATIAQLLNSFLTWRGSTNAGKRDRFSALIKKHMPGLTTDQTCVEADGALFSAHFSATLLNPCPSRMTLPPAPHQRNRGFSL